MFIVSALTGDGCEDLLNALGEDLPEGPWLFPEDQLSDLSQRAMAAEITREKLFQQLHQELPYSLTVETESWAASADGSEVRIDQTIYVQRASQKAIVLGKGGRQIKAVGQAARAELEQMLGCRVHLFLFVKVRAKWPEDPERYSEMGLEFSRLSHAVDRTRASCWPCGGTARAARSSACSRRGTAATPDWCAAASAAGRGPSTSQATFSR